MYLLERNLIILLAWVELKGSIEILMVHWNNFMNILKSVIFLFIIPPQIKMPELLIQFLINYLYSLVTKNFLFSKFNNKNTGRATYS